GGRVHEFQSVQAPGQRVGDAGMTVEKLLTVGPPPGLQLGKILLHGLNDRGVLQPHRGLLRRSVRADSVLGVPHGETPSEQRKRARARIQSFSTLPVVRFMRRATSGKGSPSRWRKINTSR